MSEILLDVQHLSHVFKLSKHAAIKAVDDVSFQMKKGEIFGLLPARSFTTESMFATERNSANTARCWKVNDRSSSRIPLPASISV